tara:strand:- start:219 stop:725 length:507 start_codon:yes stop_codon:yes gene_type:complete
MACGIYQINIGDYVYFGSSKNIENREYSHLLHLKKGDHGNNKMQNIWNKYQEFDLQIVLECDEDCRFVEEQAFIDTHYGLPECMNLHPHSTKVGEWWKGKSFTKEHKRKISEAHKGKIQGAPSEETRRKISEIKKGIPKPVIQCPHCNKSGGRPQMKRWHFDNCKEIK